MSDEIERPETFAEAGEKLREAYAELWKAAIVPLVEPAMVMLVRQLKRKRKVAHPVDHPAYFYSDEELAFMERLDQFAANVAEMGWTIDEAAEALSLLYGDGTMAGIRAANDRREPG